MSLPARDDEAAFIPPQPLVSYAENNRRYILYISDNEDGEVDPIEKMYGPFEDALDKLPPYPKPYARPAKTAEKIREEEILKLREAIRNMEQQKAQNLQKKKLKEIETEWANIKGARVRRRGVSFVENQDRLKALAEPIIIDSDTDDAMEVEVISDSAAAEFSDMQEDDRSASVVSSVEDMYFTSDNHEDSDNDSFQTAQDASEDIDPDMQAMKDDAAKIEKEIQDLNEEMEAQLKQKEDIKLKLLGIKVKLSIEKNRKELTGRRTMAQATSSPPPTLGLKRAFTDENLQADQHPWRPAQPTFNSVPAAPLITTQPMTFPQQMPPLMQQQYVPPPPPPPLSTSMPQQLALYNAGYDTTYMNGPSSPPPPPPDTMPPPFIPPPPPPPLSDTMPSSGYPTTYSQRKRFKRNGPSHPTNRSMRYTDAWNASKRFTAATAAAAPVASPYADLDSHISRMENAEQVQNALVHLSDLVSVRVFGDEKHNAFPANVERNLPKIRRLVTQDKHTSAAPVKVSSNICAS